MKAVVPAAGKGTRLRPLTSNRPKGLVRVADRPILAYAFNSLLELEVEETRVIIGYEGKQIVEHFGSNYRELDLTYVEQREQKGLAHAVECAGSFVSDTFVVLNGDNVFLDDIGDVLKAAERAHFDGALLVERREPKAVTIGGAVKVEDGRVTQVIEKPRDSTTSLMTTGCYVLPPATIDACSAISRSERGEYELADAINTLIDTGYRIACVEYTGRRVNVNTPADITSAERLLDAESTP